MHETMRTATIARSFGIEAEMIGPAEAKALYPAIDERRLEGAIFIPKDGQTNPVDTALSLVAGARMRGARIFEDTSVSRLEQAASGDYRVETARGSIRCETLVLACGLWTRDLAAQLDVRVPLYPCEHMYVVTEPLEFVEPGLPVLRDTDGHNYVKEDAGRLLVGSFEPEGKPLPPEKLPANPQFVELPEDWDQFMLPMARAMEMIPALETAGIARFMNGPESFTPDLLFALGEAPGRRNCFVSAGYDSEGIEFAPGAGRAQVHEVPFGGVVGGEHDEPDAVGAGSGIQHVVGANRLACVRGECVRPCHALLPVRRDSRASHP